MNRKLKEKCKKYIRNKYYNIDIFEKIMFMLRAYKIKIYSIKKGNIEFSIRYSVDYVKVHPITWLIWILGFFIIVWDDGIKEAIKECKDFITGADACMDIITIPYEVIEN